VFAAGAVVHDDAAICGGTICGGTICGGTIWGGTIEGGLICGGTIRGGLIMGGNIWGGTIYGGAIRGGTIEGGTIKSGLIRGGLIRVGTIRGGTPPYSHAVRWLASISSPGCVTVGCQTHSIADWLREDEGSPVQWSVYCTDAERTLIVGVIKILDMQMQAGVCDWMAE
jgi:hypothetical protein